jgi:hypothetical protein
MVPTSFWRSCRALLPRAAIAALGSAPAHATVKYVFNGKPYTYIYPTTGCLTKKMRLTMTIVYNAKLAPNLSNVSVPAVSWTINDGYHYFKDSAATAVAPLQSTFSTDGTGKITAWSVNSYYYAANKITLLYSTHSTHTTLSGDYSDDAKCNPATIGSNTVPGAWQFN